jgi:hypothetical protein
MPSTTIADSAPFAQSSPPIDTPSGVITGIAVDLIATLWAPRFPSPELIDQAAALLPRIHSAVAARHDLLNEGPRSYIRIGPGVVEVRSKDFARAERTAERQARHDRLSADMLAAYLAEHGEYPEDPEPSRSITCWSRKSRANMVRTLGLLDFTPMYADPTRLPGMITLTYPGCWLRVAPNGRAVQKHLKALRKRYERAYGETLRCIWKKEFQGRLDRCECTVCDGFDDGRAPHVHMLMVPPHTLVDGQHFMAWLSSTWADIVAHPDPEQAKRHLGAGTRVDFGEGLRACDPKRVAVYFGKHSTFKDKEYQHLVPEAWQEPGAGPGRFWGYWGLEKKTAVVEVDVRDAITAGRTLRRWSAAQQVTSEKTRPRTKGGRVIPKYHDVIGLAGLELIMSRDEPKYRKVRGRAKRMTTNRGFVMVNSGPAMVSQLARYLDMAREY